MPLNSTAYIARQLGRPSGFIGGVVLPRLFNWRNAALNDFTQENLDLIATSHVLEVGFGGGYLLGRIAAAASQGAVLPFDASPAMVGYCHRHQRRLVQSGRLCIACASAEALPLPPAAVDRACTVNTLFYVADPFRAVAELWRVLAEAGRVAICFTLRQSLQDRDFAQQGLTLFDASDVELLLDKAGFGDIRVATSSDRRREFACITAVKVA